jgi:hypothetical protein
MPSLRRPFRLIPGLEKTRCSGPKRTELFVANRGASERGAIGSKA